MGRVYLTGHSQGGGIAGYFACRFADQVTGAAMVQGLAIKAVFFGAYVVSMLRVVGLRPVPFVISFTSYFIALHLTEALFMRRLFNT